MLIRVLLGLFAAFGSVAFAEPATKSVQAGKVTLTEDVTASNATLVCTKGTDDRLLCKPLESGDVEFSTNNLIVLRGPITAQSASSFVQKFHELEHKDEVQKIYIYVRSPGGSIFAGDYISNMIDSSKKEVVVVIDFAASMAFHVSQYADKRLMLPTGTLMQHHASGGTGDGEFPNVDKQWDWIKRKVGMMNKKDSTACKNTTYEEFMKNIDRDWWLLSDEALAAGCVDSVATRVTCSKDLSQKTVQETFSFFGMDIELEWSGCPLETYPRSVRIANKFGRFDSLSNDQRKAADEFIMLVSDPLQYYNTKGSFDLEKYVERRGEDKLSAPAPAPRF